MSNWTSDVRDNKSHNCDFCLKTVTQCGESATQSGVGSCWQDIYFFSSHILLSLSWHFCQLRTGGHRCWRQVSPYFYSPLHFQRLWKTGNRAEDAGTEQGLVRELMLWKAEQCDRKVLEVRMCSLFSGSWPHRARDSTLLHNNPPPNTPPKIQTQKRDVLWRTCHLLISSLCRAGRRQMHEPVCRRKKNFFPWHTAGEGVCTKQLLCVLPRHPRL